MKTTRTTRTLSRLAALALAVGLATGCEASDPVGPEIPPADAPEASGAVVIEGIVDPSPLGQPAGAPGGMASLAAAPSAAGITVEVEGAGVVDTTDADGSFRLEVPADDGTVRIRFRRGDIDASIVLQGLTPGTILGIEVQVGASQASVKDSKKGDHGEFRGIASLVEVRGRAPERVMALDVHDGDGRASRVLVQEKGTRFHPEGNLHTFDDLLRFLETDWAVRVRGEGRLTDTGAILAHRIRAEVRGDHPDLAEFRGLSALVEVRGEAPHRVLAIDVREGGDGTPQRVLVEEDGTRFAQDGTLVSFEELLRAYEKDPAVKVAGEGRLTDTGAIVALRIRAEARRDLPDGLVEFDGLSALVELRGEAPHRIMALDVRDEDGRADRVLVREDETRFAQDGDLVSFEELLRAYGDDPAVKVEGEGRPTDTGAIAALRLKAETREHDGGPDHPLEFEGIADFVSLRGDAPARVLRLEVTQGDRAVLVDVIEGRTILDNEGDYTSFGDLLAAAESDVRLEVEGEGVRQDDGSIAAAEIKAEVHD